MTKLNLANSPSDESVALGSRQQSEERGLIERLEDDFYERVFLPSFTTLSACMEVIECPN